MTRTRPGRGLTPPRAEGFDVVKRALVGAPMSSEAMEHTLLRKTLALPIFASDALSSVAYATESALIVIVGTSLASAYLVVPVAAGHGWNPARFPSLPAPPVCAYLAFALPK